MKTPFYDSASNWHGQYDIDPVYGLRLTDVMHDGNYFIRETKLLRLMVQSEPDDQGRFAEQQLDLMTGFDPSSVHVKNVSFQEPRGFFSPTFEISASYRFVDLLGVPGQDLDLKLRFLFTPREIDPPHEPAQILYASRFYPLIDFEVSAPSGPWGALSIVNGVRADIKLHFEVRGTHLAPNPIPSADWFSAGALASLNQLGQEGGLFQDEDSADPGDAVDYVITDALGGLAGVPPLLTTGRKQALASGAVFQAAEKPLLYEVATGCYKKGVALKWENYHQWRPLAGGAYPPTPGTTFAVHQHWVWGDFFGKGPVGAPDFAGWSGPGSPMIDPLLPDQDAHIAILREPRASALEGHLPVCGFDQFAEMFKAQSATPQSLGPQDSLVQWFSIRARRDPMAARFAGVMFAHGIFFAHETSVGGFGQVMATQGRMTGAESAQYIPGRPAVDWTR